MLRQYGPTVSRLSARPVYGRAVGVIPIGTILYPVEDRCRDQVRLANPWIVEAWLPREIGAAARVNGRYANRFMAGGHLAVVRSLRDGRRRRVADWLLLDAFDRQYNN